MILLRITVAFNSLDNAYSDLYERQVAFEENTTTENKERLLSSLNNFKHKLRIYEAGVKSLYIRGGDLSIKDGKF